MIAGTRGPLVTKGFLSFQASFSYPGIGVVTRKGGTWSKSPPCSS